MISQKPAAAVQPAKGPILVLILLSLVWGYSWPVVKITLAYAPVLEFATLRIAVGALGLMVYLRFFSRSPFWPVDWVPVIVLAALMTSGFSILSVVPVLTGGAGKTSVLIFTMPFWLLLFAHPILGERIHGAQWIAVLLAFIGLALIIEPWHLKGTLIGNLSAIAAGASWAASALYVKWYRARHRLDLATVTAWQMVVGLVPIALLAWLVPSAGVQWSGPFIAGIIFLGLLSNALGWILWMYVLQRLPAGVAGLSTMAIPAIAVIASWLHLGEQPPPVELSGMLLIGIALAILGGLGLRDRQSTPVMP
ncbi:MAG: DMT family transporter, partial [Pseudonocardiaceae bacterium]